MPEWYSLLRASRYLKVPPWELAKQSSLWVMWAIASETAEIEAQNAAQKQIDSRRGH